MQKLISISEGMSYYEIGKLALNLLPISLSRVEASRKSKVHTVMVSRRRRLRVAFYLIEDDPLEFEKVKAAQAVEEFLKV